MVINQHYIPDNTALKMTAIGNYDGELHLHIETVNMTPQLKFAVPSPRMGDEPDAIKELWTAYAEKYPYVFAMQDVDALEVFAPLSDKLVIIQLNSSVRLGSL